MRSLIDISMCAIYSYYDEDAVEKLMQIYFGREPELLERKVIYSYIALGGFLWALWAVYKASLGEEFGGVYTHHVSVREEIL